MKRLTPSGRLSPAARAATVFFALVLHFLPVGAPRAQEPDTFDRGSGLTLAEVVGSALVRHVAVQLANGTWRMRESELRIARGAFDTEVEFTMSAGRTNTLFTRRDRERYGVAASEFGVSSYGVRAARRFRSGLTISPGVELVRQDALTMPMPPLVRTQAVLALSYPLLSLGSSTSEESAYEAATLLSEASGYDLQHARATAVHLAVDAYWSYLSAYESLQILSASEEKANRLVRETRALVEAGERPAGDLDQLRADLADRFAARLNAEHRLFESRQRVGLEMGLPIHETDALPAPATPFPAVRNIPTDILREQLIATADRRRPDLKSARRSVAAAAAERDARRFETKPALILRLDIGYTALNEHPHSVAGHLPFGPSDVGRPYTSVSVGLDWPTAKDRALGALMRQEAALEREEIAVSELRRGAASAIRVALEALQTTSVEYAKIDEAVALYAVAVENEKKRLQLGMSTQIDLLLVEERLRNTLLARLAVETRHARAIARLRFETGALLIDSASSSYEGFSVDALLTPQTLPD